jgi:hypothetical protein
VLHLALIVARTILGLSPPSSPPPSAVFDPLGLCSLATFVREKLRTVDLLASITDQLYDQFASLPAEDRKLSMKGLKTLVTELNLDSCVSMTREVKLAYRLVESLLPRLIGGISKVSTSIHFSSPSSSSSSPHPRV